MKNYVQFMKVSFLVALFMAGFSSAAQANQALTNALRQAEQGNISQATAARNSLNGTARDTLDWYLFTQKSHQFSFAQAANFLNKHPKWPYQITIQQNAEKKLGNRALSTSEAQFFNQKAPKTAQGMDAYLRTALASNVAGNNAAKAKKSLNEWWKTASISRDEQRQIFSQYSSHISRASHVARLNHLLDKREYSNGQAIADALGGGYPALARARKALGQRKGDVNGLINAVPSNLRDDVGLMFDRLQWRRKKNLNQGAIEALNTAPQAGQMRDPKRWWKERHIIVRRMMEAKQYQTAYRVASAHRQREAFPQLQAEWISGFLALRFVSQPYKAFEHFEKLYKAAESPISRARGAYWAGRASEALDSKDVANQWYKVAAKYPETFYGQFAGEKIGRQVALNTRGTAGGNGVPNNDLDKAASYLSQAGLRKETGAFLLRLKDNASSPASYEQAANLARQLGQEHIAIKIAQSLQKEKGVALGQYLYPQKVRELQNTQGVEWALINAIIRQESRFDQNAISHAGARGLMQLMPATAKETAGRAGISHQRAWLTSRPSHNITLGSKYLGQMVRRYNGNYAMAAAAYNAGPGRVDKWIKQFGDPRTGQIDFIDWAEQIPIYETRNYVQRVLEGVYVYRQSLKGKQPPVNRPIHVATN